MECGRMKYGMEREYSFVGRIYCRNICVNRGNRIWDGLNTGIKMYFVSYEGTETDVILY